MKLIFRKKLRTAFSLLLTGCISHGASSVSANQTTHRNILFILVDDLGWSDVGCYGSSFYETPHIDNLAKQGMRFTDGYAASPVCSPTRSSILTGKNPGRTGNTEYFGGPQPGPKYNRNTILQPAPYISRMLLEEKTLAEALREQGYATFFAGKWHLGHSPQFWPENQGFDINKGGHSAGGPYGGKKYFSPYGNPRLSNGPDGEHLPDRLASETIQFMETNKDKPFFAYLSFYSVHSPQISRPDLKKKYETKKKPETQWGVEANKKVRLNQNNAVYAGMVEGMDLAVGRVLSKLTELGLDENTVVIFMSDNGGVSTDGAHPTSNLPLRAGKGWIYEGGIREPLIIKAPGVTQAGSTCTTPVTSTDFYPTLLELVGAPLQPQQHLDGISIVPLLKGNDTEERAIYWHYPHYSGGLGGRPSSAIRQGDWKLIEFFEDKHVELYNLRNDIGETSDLAESQSAKTKELLEKLHAWHKEVGAKLPTPNLKYKGQ